MKKRNIPRHVGEKFTILYLDIWGMIFMIFPIILLISSIAKFRTYIFIVVIVNIIITTISFLLVAENPQTRERGIETFMKFVRYQYLGDRYLNSTQLNFTKKEALDVSKTKISKEVS